MHILFSSYNYYWRYADKNFTTLLGKDLNLTNIYTTMVGIIMDDVQHLFDAGARMLLFANAINMSTWVAAKKKGEDKAGIGCIQCPGVGSQ